MLDKNLSRRPSGRMVHCRPHQPKRGYAWPPQDDRREIERNSANRQRAKDLSSYFDVNRSGRANEYRPIPDKLSPIPPIDTRQIVPRYPTFSTRIGDKNAPPSFVYPVKHPTLASLGRHSRANGASAHRKKRTIDEHLAIIERHLQQGTCSREEFETAFYLCKHITEQRDPSDSAFQRARRLLDEYLEGREERE
jgi:hypothetical protein